VLNFSRRKSAVFLLIGAILAGLIYFAPSPWGVVLLEKHPLEPGDSLVVLKIMGEHPISERIGDFYVDEPGALRLIKSKWVTGAPAPFFLCGYHYRLHVISKGAVQESFDLNLESGCNTIVNEKGEARWFNPSLIEKFEDIYQKPRIDNKSFETLKLAREYLASTKGDPRALMTEEPEWTRFDGTFNFDYACDAAKGEGESEEACLASVSRRLRTKYPNQEFLPEARRQTFTRGKLESIGVRLSCTDSFRKRFDLFPVKKDGWTPFKPELRVVFRN